MCSCKAGARLVEVGTTNRTYVSDYEAAITPDTGALLKVHASNFRVEGFTHACGTSELAELGKRTNLPVLHDVGSGCLLATDEFGLAHEPTPQESIAAGADLVFFSGDKLLGGPQAGIVVGKTNLVRTLERHPSSPRPAHRQAQLGGPYCYAAALPQRRGASQDTHLADDWQPVGAHQGACRRMAK